MADIWFARDGKNPTRGEPFAARSLAECIEQLQLAPEQFVSPLSKTPRFGGPEDRPTDAFADFRHTVVELPEDEAEANGWRSGFYNVHMTPSEARRLLNWGEGE